jgi:hypothetical protein
MLFFLSSELKARDNIANSSKRSWQVVALYSTTAQAMEATNSTAFQLRGYANYSPPESLVWYNKHHFMLIKFRAKFTEVDEPRDHVVYPNDAIL